MENNKNAADTKNAELDCARATADKVSPKITLMGTKPVEIGASPAKVEDEE